MKLAIHHNVGSFSDRWIEYCKNNDIPYKIVNCYDSDIIEQLRDCKGLLWHWHHGNYKDVLIARHIIRAAEQMGLVCFPDSNTCWTFDDKIAQKYILESINAPLVPTYVFFDEKEAIEWAEETTWPKVFKLRRGAGSKNVRLVHSKQEAIKIIKTAFRTGFKPVSGHLAEVISQVKSKRRRKTLDLWGKIKRLPSSLRNIYIGNKYIGREIGYVYFQEFIPNNKWDYRVKVIRNICWGFRRFVREGDFRASGGGMLDFDYKQIPKDMVYIAFEIANKLKLQSVAFDFVMDWELNKPLITEFSYGFGIDEGESECYWDKSLNWHEGHFWPQDVIIENLISEIRNRGL